MTLREKVLCFAAALGMLLGMAAIMALQGCAAPQSPAEVLLPLEAGGNGEVYLRWPFFEVRAIAGGSLLAEGGPEGTTVVCVRFGDGPELCREFGP